MLELNDIETPDNYNLMEAALATCESSANQGAADVVTLQEPLPQTSHNCWCWIHQDEWQTDGLQHAKICDTAQIYPLNDKTNSNIDP